MCVFSFLLPHFSPQGYCVKRLGAGEHVPATRRAFFLQCSETRIRECEPSTHRCTCRFLSVVTSFPFSNSYKVWKDFVSLPCSVFNDIYICTLLIGISFSEQGYCEEILTCVPFDNINAYFLRMFLWKYVLEQQVQIRDVFERQTLVGARLERQMLVWDLHTPPRSTVSWRWALFGGKKGGSFAEFVENCGADPLPKSLVFRFLLYYYYFGGVVVFCFVLHSSLALVTYWRTGASFLRFEVGLDLLVWVVLLSVCFAGYLAQFICNIFDVDIQYCFGSFLAFSFLAEACFLALIRKKSEKRSMKTKHLTVV